MDGSGKETHILLTHTPIFLVVEPAGESRELVIIASFYANASVDEAEQHRGKVVKRPRL